MVRRARNDEETVVYTEDDRIKFCEAARVIGVNEAQRRLGYPKTHVTGHKWLKQLGLEVPPDNSLMRHARETKEIIGKHEQLVLLQRILTDVYDLLIRPDKSWGPADLKRLADTAHRAITTMELIQGRATDRTEMVDPTDLELRKMIEEFQDSNDAHRQNLDS